MSKRTYVLVMAFAMAAVLATGGLLAGNMGFKIAYVFNSVNVDVGGNLTDSGETHFGLPFYPHLGLTDAQSLKTDIESGPADCPGNIGNVQRFDQTQNQRESWFGAKIGGTNFLITPCESYFVTVNTDAGTPVTCPYIIAGTHNPDQECTFHGAGDFADQTSFAVGENAYALPFHTTANNAADLLGEISAANFVQRYDQLEDQRQSWFGAKIGGTNFLITPGEGYFIQMPSGVETTLKSAHY
jgi:hypothetical protein